MSIFDVLVLSHFVTDWIFQTKETAYKKLTDWKVRLWHCCIYALPMAIVSMLLLLSYPKFIQITNVVRSIADFIFIFEYYKWTHYLFDTPNVKKWIAKTFRKEENAPLWYYLGLDQILHMVTLVPVALFVLIFK